MTRTRTTRTGKTTFTDLSLGRCSGPFSPVFRFERSEMFRHEWFGEVHTNDSDTHTVPSGRWAYTPIKSNARDYSPITNAWGLLRSPWNEDSVPYLTRSNNVFSYENAG